MLPKQDPRWQQWSGNGEGVRGRQIHNKLGVSPGTWCKYVQDMGRQGRIRKQFLANT